MQSLFKPYLVGARRAVPNRIVMAPMTRTRTSPGDVPNALMATYYGQRASAGLIVSEAVDISLHGKGYARTPGIHTEEQVRGWQLVTDEVHRQGGTIFLQAWHVGRMSHQSIQPGHGAPWGVTGKRAQADVFAHDSTGKLTFMPADTPRQISTEEAASIVDEFRAAFERAKLVGFDGVEIHAANGYLLDQFLNSALNTREDRYGGQTPQSRTRLLLEIVDAGIKVWGPASVGIRVSPFGKYNDMPADPRTEETLLYLCAELNKREIAYLHAVYQLLPAGNVENSDFSEPGLDERVVWNIRKAFRGTLVWCGGFDQDSAAAALAAGWADMIAFGRPFIGNPDLVLRMQNGWPLAEADRSTYYTRDEEKGFTDFPCFEADPVMER